MLVTPFSAHLLVQSRVFEVIASSTLVAGRLNDLARQFGVEPDVFMGCLEGLVRARWVTVYIDPDSLVSIQLES